MNVQDLIIYAIGGYSVLLSKIFNTANNDAKKTAQQLSDYQKFNDEKLGKVNIKIEMIKEKLPSELKNLEKFMDLKMANMSEEFKEVKGAIKHAEKSMNDNSKAMLLMMAEFKNEREEYFKIINKLKN